MSLSTLMTQIIEQGTVISRYLILSDKLFNSQ